MNLKKAFLIFFLGLFFSTLLSAACYVIYQVSTFPSDILQSYEHEKLSRSDDNFKAEIEEGTVLNLDELKNYKLLENGTRDFDQWLKQKINNGEIEKLKRNKLAIKKAFVLEGPSFNDCSDVYCFQHRISFGEIPGIFWRGLIGIEDYRFLGHSGVDFLSILRAIVIDIKKMRLEQGASTLTQQLVRNLFLEQKKSFSRKLKEIIYSLYLEYNWDKEDILKGYFNEVFWGVGQGIKIKGLYSASLYYFSKKPSELSAFEASILISLLKGPNYYAPLLHRERLQSRATTVFNKLLELNLLSEKVDKAWSQKEWDSWIKELQELSKKRPYNVFWRFKKQRNHLLNPFETYLFHYKAQVLNEQLKQKSNQLDFGIKAFFKSINDQKISDFTFSYYNKYERDLDKAISFEKHQVGSTLKPIIYEILISKGVKWDDLVPTEALSLKLKSGVWKPKDAHVIKTPEVSVLDALVNSYNVPLVRLVEGVGFLEVENELKLYVPELKLPLAQYPAQLLGAVELSLKELSDSYSKFIARQCDLDKTPEDKLSTVLFVLSDPKITTVRNVVGDAIGQMNFFGKTGTSNNGLDNWYVFFDGKILGIIWVGKEGDRSDKKLPFYGSSTAFKLFESWVRDRGRQFNEFDCPKFGEMTPILESE